MSKIDATPAADRGSVCNDLLGPVSEARKTMSDMDIDRHLRAKIADLTSECQGLRADFERECLDTDTVLRALGFEPKNCRTDGGSLALRELLGAIEHLDVMIRRAARHEERDEVLRELDDRTNQTWVGKRKRWAALVRAQDAELCVLTDALWRACGDDEAVVRDTIASQRGGA